MYLNHIAGTEEMRMMEDCNMQNIDYDIDKKKYRELFWDNLNMGQWHWSCSKRREMFWYQLFVKDNHPLKSILIDVEKDLNIYKMNNYPRFSYQFPNTRLKHHVDEDNMVSININLMAERPIIHIEHQPYPYECALIDVGHRQHGVEPDANARLILKFCLRHPWDEVYERLSQVGLV